MPLWFTPSRITGIWNCSDKPHPSKVFQKRGAKGEVNDQDGDHTGCSSPAVPCTHINLLLNCGSFDRQPIAKNRKNMLVFQIFALSNTLPWVFWFAYGNTSENVAKNHTQLLCETGRRHSRWDCCEATSILGLNLNHVPFSSRFASKHHPLPTQVFGLTRYWHLHVRAYRCNQIIHRQIRIPWPWRSPLACWWPGTFKNTSGFRKKHD